MTTAPQDEVIWRQDFQRKMKVCSETMRRWIRDGRLPKPDVQISHKTMGWRVSTLRAAGINLL